MFASISPNTRSPEPSGEDRPLEVSYWEALRAWWRIYWPTQLLTSLVVAAFSIWLTHVINASRAEHPLQGSALERYVSLVTFVMGALVGAVCLWLFAPRIVGRPYRGFSLVVHVAPCDSRSSLLTARQRTQLWFFVWWRQLAGALAATVLAAPLNILLGTMRVSAGSEIGIAAGLFVIGPLH